MTVKVNAVVSASPSASETSPIASVGASSSFVIVPWPSPSRMVAPVGFVRVTRKVSSVSKVVSPFTGTVTGSDVSPGSNVSVWAADA